MLVVFTLFSSVAAVLAFQGGFSGDSSVATPADTQDSERTGSATIANVVDSAGAFGLGLLVTVLFDKKAKRGELIGGFRLLLLALTVMFAILFILSKDSGAFLRWELLQQPAVYYGLAWSAIATLNMQMIRFFAGEDINREDFLFWRFCGPTAVLLVALLVRVAWQGGLPWLHVDSVVGLVALAVGSVFVVVLQFTLLKDRTVADLNTIDLVIPGLTYLLALVLGLSGGRTTWLALVCIAGVLACRFLAETLPAQWPGWSGAVRKWRDLWAGRSDDPTLRIAGWLLRVNLFGLVLSLLLFGPIVVDFLYWMGGRSGGADPRTRPLFQNGSWAGFLVLFVLVSQVLAMTLLARKVREIMRDQLLKHFYLDTVGKSHMFKRLFKDVLGVLTRVLKAGPLLGDGPADLRRVRAGARVGYSLATGAVDAAKTALDNSRPVPELNPDPVPAKRLLEKQFDVLREVVQMDKAKMTYDFSAIPDTTRWAVDDDRLLLVWHNLLINAQDAWQRDHRREGLAGLEIDVTGWVAPACKELDEEGEQVVVQIEDTGGGLPPVTAEDTLDQWMRRFKGSSTPGGQGVGMWISWVYIDGHRGRLLIGDDVPLVKPRRFKGLLVQIRIPAAAGGPEETKKEGAV
jgi:signal transduction histidine kinase